MNATAVGYWVAPWARNRGLATRAVETLSAWALGDGGFDRLELTTHPENTASQRVAEKAGFNREGLVTGYVQTAVRTARLGRLLAAPLSRSNEPGS